MKKIHIQESCSDPALHSTHGNSQGLGILRDPRPSGLLTHPQHAAEGGPTSLASGPLSSLRMCNSMSLNDREDWAKENSKQYVCSIVLMAALSPPTKTQLNHSWKASTSCRDPQSPRPPPQHLLFNICSWKLHTYVLEIFAEIWFLLFSLTQFRGSQDLSLVGPT